MFIKNLNIPWGTFLKAKIKFRKTQILFDTH